CDGKWSDANKFSHFPLLPFTLSRNRQHFSCCSNSRICIWFIQPKLNFYERQSRNAVIRQIKTYKMKTIIKNNLLEKYYNECVQNLEYQLNDYPLKKGTRTSILFGFIYKTCVK